MWDKLSGEPIYNTIVWQDRRTARYTDKLTAEYGDLIRERTGLMVDSYFSAPKLHWLMENVPQAKSLLAQGRLLAGTMDTWLIWKMTHVGLVEIAAALGGGRQDFRLGSHDKIQGKLKLDLFTKKLGGNADMLLEHSVEVALTASHFCGNLGDLDDTPVLRDEPDRLADQGKWLKARGPSRAQCADQQDVPGMRRFMETIPASAWSITRGG